MAHSWLRHATATSQRTLPWRTVGPTLCLCTMRAVASSAGSRGLAASPSLFRASRSFHSFSVQSAAVSSPTQNLSTSQLSKAESQSNGTVVAAVASSSAAEATGHATTHDCARDHQSDSSSSETGDDDSSSSSSSSSDRVPPWYLRRSWWRLQLAELRDGTLLLAQFIAFLHLVRTNVVDIMACAGPSMLPTMAEGGDVLLVAKSNLVADLFEWINARSVSAEAADGQIQPSPPPAVSSSPSSSSSRWSLSSLFGPLSLRYHRGDVVVAASPNKADSRVCKRLVGWEGDVLFLPARGGGWFSSGPPPLHPTQIQSGHVWLQGDNLLNSTDSRDYGAVPQGLLQGRVVWKIYPLSEWGAVRNTMQFAGEAVSGRMRQQQDDPAEEDEAEVERARALLEWNRIIRDQQQQQRMQQQRLTPDSQSHSSPLWPQTPQAPALQPRPSHSQPEASLTPSPAH